jgi:hypothetical protein
VEFVSSYHGSSVAAELFFVVLRQSLARLQYGCSKYIRASPHIQGFSLLRLAARYRVLRSRWCQSGVKSGRWSGIPRSHERVVPSGGYISRTRYSRCGNSVHPRSLTVGRCGALGGNGFARCGGDFGCEDLSGEAYVAAPTATQPYVPVVEAYKVWRCLPGARHRASNHFSSLRLLSTVFSMKWTPCAPS